MHTVEQIIEKLQLKPHPEGGFYRETYRCTDTVDSHNLPAVFCKQGESIGYSREDGRRETLEWQLDEVALEKKAAQKAQEKGAVKTDAKPSAAGNGTSRVWSTAMYYLLTSDSFSAMHRLKADEVYHFYLGDAIEMLNLNPDGSEQVIRLGSDIIGGALVQHTVAAGVWQGSKLVDGGKFALLGTTVSPGFEFSDFEEGTKDDLCAKYPGSAKLIGRLTRK
jgi:Uncharacterized conserved protein